MSRFCKKVWTESEKNYFKRDKLKKQCITLNSMVNLL